MALRRDPDAAPPAGASVLISAAGTATAYGLARTLRARWGASVRIAGTDINPPRLVPAAPLLDACHQVPYSSDPGFEEALDDLLALAPGTIYVPLIDHEILAASSRTLPHRARLLGPGAGAAAACADKLEVAQLLLDAGLPAARAMPVRDAAWTEPGLVVKPRGGFGSRGVRICTTEEEWARARQDASSADIAQPLLVGAETTIDAFVDHEGAVRAVARDRIDVRGGVATKAVVYEDPGFEALAGSVASALGLRGTFCFQVMRDAAGVPAITDVNARPGGGTRMTVVAGVDLLSAPFAQAWGLPVDPMLPRLSASRTVVRHWEEDVR